jgi:hypothetical protein
MTVWQDNVVPHLVHLTQRPLVKHVTIVMVMTNSVTVFPETISPTLFAVNDRAVTLNMKICTSEEGVKKQLHWTMIALIICNATVLQLCGVQQKTVAVLVTHQKHANAERFRIVDMCQRRTHSHPLPTPHKNVEVVIAVRNWAVTRNVMPLLDWASNVSSKNNVQWILVVTVVDACVVVVIDRMVERVHSYQLLHNHHRLLSLGHVLLLVVLEVCLEGEVALMDKESDQFWANWQVVQARAAAKVACLVI